MTQTEQPERFGVVTSDRIGESSRHHMIRSFTEKPSQFISNQINGGIYIFNHQIIDIIQPDNLF